MTRLLLVDDEPNVLRALVRTLRAGLPDDARVETFTDAREALKRALDTAFDVVISDYRMPAMDGVSFLREFRTIQPDPPRLILSGYADFDALVTAINEVAIFRFVAKPWDDLALLGVVNAAIAESRKRVEDQRLADERRADLGLVSAQELERRRLERLEPGITRVRWGPDGSVLLDDFDLDDDDDGFGSQPPPKPRDGQP